MSGRKDSTAGRKRAAGAAVERRPGRKRGATSSEHAIKVMIVDDDDDIRAGIAAILSEDTSIEVIAQADDGVSAIRMADDLRPDVIIMDIAMPLIDGITATRHIVDRMPTTRVLTVSSYTDVDRVRSIIDAGASGYVVKSSVRRELITAVRSVANGMVFLSPAISGQLLQSILADKPGRAEIDQGTVTSDGLNQ